MVFLVNVIIKENLVCYDKCLMGTPVNRIEEMFSCFYQIFNIKKISIKVSFKGMFYLSDF